MAIPPVTPSPVPGISSGNSDTRLDSGSETRIEAPSLQEQRKVARAEQNLAILQASQTTTISAGNQPLSLVLQAAIDAINDELQPLLGDNAIERTQQQGLDVSPEATAERIVSLTTGLFSLFQQQRPEFSEAEQLDQFLEVIGGGIDQGFAEAREILDGLGVLEGDIASNIDKTYELVQQGLARFREGFLPGAVESEEAGAIQAPGT